MTGNGRCSCWADCAPRLRQSLLHSLKVRLRLELLLRDKRDSLPNIDGKMVFVSGLPRSGATLVHNLLSFDTSMFAAFDFGEMHDPALPQVPDIEVKVRLERLKRAMPQVQYWMSGNVISDQKSS